MCIKWRATVTLLGVATIATAVYMYDLEYCGNRVFRKDHYCPVVWIQI